MKNKLLVGAILLFTMIFYSSMASEAAEVSEWQEIFLNDSAAGVLENVDKVDYGYNIMSRPYTGECYTVYPDVSAQTDENSNPNAAYLLVNNTGGNGTIDAVNESRWFAFILNEKSKVSVLAGMAESMDADLYIFSYDSASGNLSIIGASTNSTLGRSEYYSEVLDAGTYFIAVTSYAGTGAYNIAFWNTNIDINYEVNDSPEVATDITFGNKMIGAIDCPNDLDYYKFTVTEHTWIKLWGEFPDGYVLDLAGWSEGAECSIVEASESIYHFKPGTYWFRVRSANGGYSSTVSYSLLFEKRYESNKDDYFKFGYGADTGMEIKQSFDNKLHYVNGHKVDIEYNYYWDGSNTAGEQVYRITIHPDANTVCTSMEIVYFKSSTHPIKKNYYNKPVLLMHFRSDDEFYRIDCRCSGAYAGETIVHNSKFVDVLIDPATGELVDILDPNYFYSFHHDGSTSIKVDRKYDTINWQ